MVAHLIRRETSLLFNRRAKLLTFYFRIPSILGQAVLLRVLLCNAFFVKHCNSLPCFNTLPFPFIIASLNRRHSNYRVLRLLLTSVDTKLYRYKRLPLKDALHLSPRYLQISQSRFINFRFIQPLHLHNIIPYSKGLLFLQKHYPTFKVPLYNPESFDTLLSTPLPMLFASEASTIRLFIALNKGNKESYISFNKITVCIFV